MPQRSQSVVYAVLLTGLVVGLILLLLQTACPTVTTQGEPGNREEHDGAGRDKAADIGERSVRTPLGQPPSLWGDVKLPSGAVVSGAIVIFDPTNRVIRDVEGLWSIATMARSSFETVSNTPGPWRGPTLAVKSDLTGRFILHQVSAATPGRLGVWSTRFGAAVLTVPGEFRSGDTVVLPQTCQLTVSFVSALGTLEGGQLSVSELDSGKTRTFFEVSSSQTIEVALSPNTYMLTARFAEHKQTKTIVLRRANERARMDFSFGGTSPEPTHEWILVDGAQTAWTLDRLRPLIDDDDELRVAWLKRVARDLATLRMEARQVKFGQYDGNRGSLTWAGSVRPSGYLALWEGNRLVLSGRVTATARAVVMTPIVATLPPLIDVYVISGRGACREVTVAYGRYIGRGGREKEILGQLASHSGHVRIDDPKLAGVRIMWLAAKADSEMEGFSDIRLPSDTYCRVDMHVSEPGGPVQFAVTDRGNPVSSALVCVVGMSGRPAGDLESTVMVTGESGQGLVDGLPQGDYRLIVKKSGYLISVTALSITSARQSIRVKLNSGRDVRVMLSKSGSYRLRWRTPVAGLVYSDRAVGEVRHGSAFSIPSVDSSTGTIEVLDSSDEVAGRAEWLRGETSVRIRIR